MKIRQYPFYALFLVSLTFVQLLIQPSSACAQALVPSPAQLNFGTVYENAPDSILLTLTNTLSRPVQVRSMRFYSTYGAPAFSTSASWFTVPANGSSTVWIRFSPRHNILHNSELLIFDDGLRGVTRVDLTGQGRYSNSYYPSTENLSEEPLKSALRTLLAIGYDTLGYVVARDSMFMQIDNKARNGQGATQNTIESCYTGALAVGYTDRTDCQNTFSFNTEHTFPQGFFGSLEPMRSDLHHLYPCDDLSNNTRGNNPFGVVTNPTYSDGGSLSDGSFFEPRDYQKGRASRSLLYFVIRYQDYTNFVRPQESLLRSWHAAFPPDATERRRNDDIYSDQHNRNPFVDYPQFLERIHAVANTSIEPADSSLDFSEDTLVYGFVPPGNTAVYQYVIANDGNRPVGLSNFSLSIPSVFSFASGGNGVSLQPGDAAVVQISATPSGSGSVAAFLSYSTTLPGSPSVSVPIYLNDSLLNTVTDPPSASFEVFPNPTGDRLFIRTDLKASFSLVLTDITGRILAVLHDANPVSVSLDLSLLPAGTYLLTASSGNSLFRRTVLKQ
ncbi:MAG: hypothetical protein RL213_499 [Bacteroidota bacterium]|jgi:hypothetical protein